MKQVIILFGPPGAGKGTQSELLSEALGYYHLESSKVLERCFKKESLDKVFTVEGKDYKVGDEIENWKKGILTSPPFITGLMTEEIQKLHKDGESFIMSGSPRTLYEAQKEMPVLSELYGKENIKITMIEISAEVTIFRNTHRKICELMRHSILFNKETEKLTLCPLDGSKLMKRKDLDDPETIKTRLVQYKERTLPLFEYFEKNGYNVAKIDGEKSVAEVHQEIISSIKM
ncbi:MAG: nucleoside monophosphate kinase [Patescibacteria group bacterium]|mgnify:CR=1 FL=1